MSERHVMVAVEDELSGAVMRRLILESGRNFIVLDVFNARGCGQLKSGMTKFRNASYVVPHIVLTDLDRYLCPPALLAAWGATTLPAGLLLRVAVREVEAWLLADRAGIAGFLGVAKNKVPEVPETEDDPKRCLLNLARKGRKKRLALEIVPEAGSPAPIGPFYNQRLSEFVSAAWSVADARLNSPSLDRALTRLSNFMPEP
jgi:hypothetical protein